MTHYEYEQQRWLRPENCFWLDVKRNKPWQAEETSNLSIHLKLHCTRTLVESQNNMKSLE